MSSNQFKVKGKNGIEIVTETKTNIRVQGEDGITLHPGMSKFTLSDGRCLTPKDVNTFEIKDTNEIFERINS